MTISARMSEMPKQSVIMLESSFLNNFEFKRLQIAPQCGQIKPRDFVTISNSTISFSIRRTKAFFNCGQPMP